LLSEVSRLDERITHHDQHIEASPRQILLHGNSPSARWSVTATGDQHRGHGHDFSEMVASSVPGWVCYLGSTARGANMAGTQHRKAGDFLFCVHCCWARVLFWWRQNKTDPISRWATALAERRGWRAVVATCGESAKCAGQCRIGVIHSGYRSDQTNQVSFPPSRDAGVDVQGWTCVRVTVRAASGGIG
jgi:transposase